MDFANRSADGLPESELIAASRDGDRDAYAELWTRHRAAAVRAAKPLAFNNAEDVVSDSFIAIWEQMQRGGGPTGHFRAYLLSTVRNRAVTRYHAESRVQVVAEVDGDPVQDSSHGLEAAEQRRDVTVAFRSLPERWQQVLWLTEVEQIPRNDIAAKLDLSPNSVSALTRRAKEGLKIAWLEEILPSPEQQVHPQVQGLLPRFVRGSLGAKDRAAVRSHLTSCALCQATADQIKQENHRLGGKSAGVLGLVLVGGSTAVGQNVTAAGATPLLAVLHNMGLLPKLLALGSAVLLAGAAIVIAVLVQPQADDGVATGQNSPGKSDSERTRVADSTATEPRGSQSGTAQSSDGSAGSQLPAAPGGGSAGGGGSSGEAEDPVTPRGEFIASGSGAAGIAPVVSGVAAPGSNVAVSVAGLSFTVEAASDGSWSTDLSTLGLPVGDYIAQVSTAVSNWVPNTHSLPFAISTPSASLASPGVAGTGADISLLGIPGSQVCVRLGSGTYQIFPLDSAGAGGGRLSAPWSPGMTIRLGYCTDGRFGPFNVSTL
ncbi:MAG: sigma-70 family RNA polymerase sigma factor [Actinobacteria bacterium]|nr:sigma-70 family RNA polymerase sigma factor [Actinomycetota bacterium]